jgi:hypothetical protein
MEGAQAGGAGADGRVADPESPQVQAVTRRWMSVMVRVMAGDFELLERWGEMYRREPSAHGQGGAPTTEMIDYMQRRSTCACGCCTSTSAKRGCGGCATCPTRNGPAWTGMGGG